VRYAWSTPFSENKPLRVKPLSEAAFLISGRLAAVAKKGSLLSLGRCAFQGKNAISAKLYAQKKRLSIKKQRAGSEQV
jgi:hypothetical protein